MASFKDINGREWLIKLDAPTIKDVREALHFDLLDDKAFSRLATDAVLLVDVLWIICRSQAQAANIHDRQFGEALVGDPIEAAAKALTEARIAFSPASERSLLRSLAEKETAVRSKAIALAMAKINDPQLEATLMEAAEAKIKQELDQILTSLNSASNSPEKSASTPEA